MIRQIKWLKWIYLFLAILGAVLPTLANIEFAKSYGPAFDIKLFTFATAVKTLLPK